MATKEKVIATLDDLIEDHRIISEPDVPDDVVFTTFSYLYLLEKGWGAKTFGSELFELAVKRNEQHSRDEQDN
jgi:hypothetical protein